MADLSGLAAPRALLAAWVAAWSAAAFAACALDKRRAVQSRARVPERTLLLLALAGGSPGLVVGMLAARHKTRKGSFLARLALVLAAQLALAAWWLRG
jgi:uncharacterized membrane protein YsdA (DUF1294 family)